MDYSLLPPLPEGAKHISTVKEYEHLFGYAALPDGTILTCKPSKQTKGIKYLDHWREKRTYKTKVGYVLIKTKTKGNNGKCVTDKLHRVIGSLFIQNPYNYPVINHKNGIKNDNRAENLEWVTHRMNSVHSIKNGFRNTANGQRLPNSILSDDKIVSIFEMKAKGFKNKEIAAIYGIDLSAISRILNRQSWRHVPISYELYKLAHRSYKLLKQQRI